MSARVLTLFDDTEFQPEQIAAVGKSRAVKKAKPKDEVAEKPKKKKKAEEQEPDMLDGWAADKQYYSIGEVAALFSVKTSHIRFWTNEFAIKVRTPRKG